MATLSITTTETYPKSGETYIIREKSSKGVIGLQDGVVRLVPESKGMATYSRLLNDSSCHWHCTLKESGWYVFRNATSGTWLGYDFKDSLKLPGEKLTVHGGFKNGKHSGSQSICIEHDPRGGFALLIFHMNMKNLISLNQVTTEGNMGELFLDYRSEEGRTLFEFINV
jgi:hypothetical protein